MHFSSAYPRSMSASMRREARRGSSNSTRKGMEAVDCRPLVLRAVATIRYSPPSSGIHSSLVTLVAVEVPSASS